MSVAGIWNVVIKNPMIEQKPVLNFTQINNKIIGTMAMPGNPLGSLTRGRIAGTTATMRGRVIKPVPMALVFKVNIVGDSLIGTCTIDAKSFPVTGKRVGMDTIPKGRLARWKNFLFS